jgi:hypothetical protein
MTDTDDVLRDKLNASWRFFYKRGFVDGFGHVSARTQRSDRILIAPHDLTRHSRPEDFVVVRDPANQAARVRRAATPQAQGCRRPRHASQTAGPSSRT